MVVFHCDCSRVPTLPGFFCDDGLFIVVEGSALQGIIVFVLVSIRTAAGQPDQYNTFDGLQTRR